MRSLCDLASLRETRHSLTVAARLFLLARRVAGVHLLWDLCELCGLVVLRSHAEHGNEVSHLEHGKEVKMQNARRSDADGTRTRNHWIDSPVL